MSHFFVMLSVVMLSVVMQSVVPPCACPCRCSLHRLLYTHTESLGETKYRHDFNTYNLLDFSKYFKTLIAAHSKTPAFGL